MSGEDQIYRGAVQKHCLFLNLADREVVWGEQVGVINNDESGVNLARANRAAL